MIAMLRIDERRLDDHLLDPDLAQLLLDRLHLGLGRLLLRLVAAHTMTSWAYVSRVSRTVAA